MVPGGDLRQVRDETFAADAAGVDAGALLETDGPVLLSPYSRMCWDSYLTLEVQRSQAACNKGVDYGCASGGRMYVDHGCRGVFRCGTYGSEEVECSSWGFQRTHCICDSFPMSE